MVRKKTLLALLGLGLSAHASFGQERIEPVYSIWDVKLGQPVSQVPDAEVGEISCGTAGGPPGQSLASFKDFMTCTPEPSGLREVEFNYDDEQDYIAKAEEVEFKFLQGGTSAYAHPIVVSVLVDGAGLVQGIRVITDDRASERDRRTAMVLSRNFKARFSDWNLSCQNLPMKDGEMKVGNQFIHELCHGTNPDGSGQRVLIEASYLRKKGQEAISRETQQVIKGAYESQTWMELVNPPYSPSEAP